MRWVIGALALLLALLQFQLWFGPGSVPTLIELHSSLDEQRQANERAQARNDALAAEVEDLKEGLDALEERARYQLGMIREDETFYQVIEED
ncbi:cell division protein FtsB [Halorhodospira halochloris]|uniref:Cell division protein FtsB n=1 Tax=Halorhodospira halochloris TaxID=1052 RepID=A0A110B1L8_HALHR|nr:cell division protein FtsB [Halorhodospira halochloris]MBK1651203.1 cell division protein FtsB [Halorhodospira halochloris]MCG5530716.1 cell division protein FtsB [Halorhodospira halochloris]MCG5547652.1 cell division protein FtsB [Halorhodospira halochloris]BAU57475.2 cell division protein DivIC [Halorhodospira halochloris]